MSLSLVRRVTLSGIANGWGDQHYIDFKMLTGESIVQYRTQIIERGTDFSEADAQEAAKILKNQFVDGVGVGEDGGNVELVADDVETLFRIAGVGPEMIKAVIGGELKKISTQSET